MRILGIETSCDETAAAVVEDGTNILSHVVASSAQIQEKYGGVVPEVAARRQVETIIPVITEAIRPSNHSTTPAIDALAVTIGPGLIGSLLVGIETVKTLSYLWGKPLVPVNHLVGHIYSAWLGDWKADGGERKADSQKQKTEDRAMPKFPSLVLIVSGGHTELVLMQSHGEFKKISQTLDDAAGEAFDKVAQLLDLSYPGGPEIEKLARQGNPQAYDLPRPMIDSGDYNFSFSGLKTAVLHQAHPSGVPTRHKADLAASFQQAVIDVLISKTLHAAKEYNVKSILLTGGVAANSALRKTFQDEIDKLTGVNFYCPPIDLATDNATYIAAAAYFNYDSWVIKPGRPDLFSLGPDPNLKEGSYPDKRGQKAGEAPGR